MPYAGYGVALLSTIQGLLFVCSLAALLLVAAWLLESVEDDMRVSMARGALEPTRPVGPGPADAEGAA